MWHVHCLVSELLKIRTGPLCLQVCAQHTGEGDGTPLQSSCLENPMDRGAWWGTVHGVAKSRTRLSDFTFTFHFHVSEKEMATHSSVLAWRIPGTGEPGGLPSMGLHRVRHNWSDLAAAAAQHIVHAQWRFSPASWNHIFGSCKYSTLMAPKIAMPVWLACATLSIHFPEWN